MFHCMRRILGMLCCRDEDVLGSEDDSPRDTDNDFDSQADPSPGGDTGRSQLSASVTVEDLPCHDDNFNRLADQSPGDTCTAPAASEIGKASFCQDDDDQIDTLLGDTRTSQGASDTDDKVLFCSGDDSKGLTVESLGDDTFNSLVGLSAKETGMSDGTSSKGKVVSCQDVQLIDHQAREIGPSQNVSHSDEATFFQYDGVVGLDADVMKIKEKLTGHPSRLKIIPIVGMGGIGKTTLAKIVYKDPLISYHFYIRAWVTVSQDYEFRNVLMSLLSSISTIPSVASQISNQRLAEMLYRALKGNRYLIVLDDVWSTKIWSDIKRLFPNENNGSRIIVTSRFTGVAAYAYPENSPHRLNFLSNDESWRLLRNKVFAEEIFPHELVEIGKQIAERCHGLPLTIVVIAGHLSKIKSKLDCWKDVAEKIDNIITRDEEKILDILSLSYSYLPQHLKACFLYVGGFPKCSDIHVQKLIRLWSATGFLQAESPNSLEEMAMKCLKDLISRNLVIIKRRRSDGGIRTCGLHDFLWDLSKREMRKEGEHVFHNCHLSHYFYDTADDREYFMGLTSSFLKFDSSSESESKFPLLDSVDFTQLRVLDFALYPLYHFPMEITELIDLRYLALSTCADIPGAVSKLRNLETLINHHKSAGRILPKEIWEMPRLRHLHVGTICYLPDPSDAQVEGNGVLTPDLRTLSSINISSCTKEVLSGIPNVKELKICEILEEDDRLFFDRLSNNLVYLHQLEKLKMYFNVEIEIHREIPICGIFATPIKQLTLKGSHLPWEDMDTLARTLPNLEVLKLKENAFKGPEYEQIEEFPRLKVLLFEGLDLVHWKAYSFHFPSLRRLVFRSCRYLDEIPDDIGNIQTLDLIEMIGCNKSANKSAKSIRNEQRSVGNDFLQVRIVRNIIAQALTIYVLMIMLVQLYLCKERIRTDETLKYDDDEARPSNVNRTEDLTSILEENSVISEMRKILLIVIALIVYLRNSDDEEEDANRNVYSEENEDWLG